MSADYFKTKGLSSRSKFIKALNLKLGFVCALFLLQSCAGKAINAASLADAKKIDSLQTQIKVLENRMDHMMDEVNLMRDRLETVRTQASKKDYELPKPSDVAQRVVLKKNVKNFLGVNAGDSSAGKAYTLTNADLRKNKAKKAAKKKPSQKRKAASPQKKALNQYNSAYKLYQVGEYVTARKSFLDFLQDNPKHDYADNALFWLGESYYNQNKYKEALPYYEQVLTQYPKENKVPESLYRKTACMIKLSEEEEAKKSLLTLIKRYPDHSITDKAKKKFLSKLIR